MLLLSIVIPAYNRAHVLNRCIQSVIQQTFFDFELIVVDDGSLDNTAMVMEPFLSDPRVSYVYQTNQGVSVARNKGASMAKGEYMIFLDSDDALKKGYFDAISAASGENIDVFFVGFDLYKADKFFTTTRPNYPYGKYSEDGLYLAGCFVIKRDLFLNVGGYDSAITYGENTELSIRLEPLLRKKKFLDTSFISIYQATENRASISLKNIIASNEYILKKHVVYYRTHPHPKWLYHNVLAVGYAKTNDIGKAKNHLNEAIKTFPWRISPYLRYIVLVFPYLRKLIYRV